LEGRGGEPRLGSESRLGDTKERTLGGGGLAVSAERLAVGFFKGKYIDKLAGL